MCCRTSPAIPRRWRAWRAPICKSGDLERARPPCSWCGPDGAQDEAIRAVEAELKLREARRAPESGETAALRAKLAADPKDHQARYDLAWRWMPAATATAPSTELLELVRRDRKWNEEAARKQLVTLFEAMGPTDPRTIEARRKLSGHPVLLMPRHYHAYSDLPRLAAAVSA